MRFPVRQAPRISLIFAVSLVSADALQIRTYSAARHDRFTGFPGTPVVNGAAWFDGSQYSGVGWWVNDPQRQFVLISPKHVLMANHFTIPVGAQVRFLDQSGTLYTATVASLTNVVKDAQVTDITVARLNAPVPNVAVIKYLNLPENHHYFTSNLQVFGWNGSGGNHPVVGKGILRYVYNEDDTPLNIQLSEFGYVVSSGDQDDCFFIGGDSGSPTFAETKNEPALIGIHYGVDALPGNVVNYSYDSFVPRYVAEINTILTAAGDSPMTPVFTDPTPLVLTGATTPDPFRHAAAGAATFTFENQGATAALNPSVTLTFPSGAAPSTVTASGWVNDVAGPLVWTYHRASLAAAATTDFVASWSSVPTISTLPVSIRHISDGSPQQTSEYDLEPTVSYAAWSAGLAQPGTGDDPDGDGKTNLVEYAFGSSPTSGSTALSPTVVAGSVITTSGGIATLKFPVRSDSQVRGLSYVLEFSNNLTSWTEPQPIGTTSSFASYSPAISGFKNRIVTFPANEARKFVRVRVTLDESVPGMAVP